MYNVHYLHTHNECASWVFRILNYELILCTIHLPCHDYKGLKIPKIVKFMTMNIVKIRGSCVIDNLTHIISLLLT